MRKLGLGLSFITMAVFAACGDDSSSGADVLNESSSSSEVNDGPSSNFDNKDSSSSEGTSSGKSEVSSSDSSKETSSSSSQYSSSSENVTIVDPSTVVKGTMTDERDGQTYRTVKIGDQTWMAENLNYATDNSYCYNDATLSCDTYGRLYTWTTAVGKTEVECGYGNECGLGTGDIRGVCPMGWHLPSFLEWNALFAAVGDSSTAGIKLKTTTGWRGDGNGTDDYGFSALPAGYRTNNGAYNLKGDHTYFWNSTEFNKFYVYYTGLYSSGDYAKWSVNTKSGGYSVRCLKD
jgi:uncharacterized protein (TIGR02145 family)